jgi:iron complex outermembrane receptor protein
MGGNYSTRSASLYLSKENKQFSYGIHFDHFSTEGVREIDTVHTMDQQKSTNGGISLSYRPSGGTQLFGSLDFTRNNSFYAGTMTLAEFQNNPMQSGSSDKGFGLNASDSTQQKYRSQTATIGLEQLITAEDSLKISASQEIKRSDFIINPVLSPYSLSSDYRIQQINATLSHANNQFSYAMGSQITQGDVDYSRNKISKDTVAVFIAGAYQVDQHTLSVGGRYEEANYHYQDSTSNTKTKDSLQSYELGYNYLLDPKQSLFAHYAHGFQFPDVNRLMLFDSTSPYTDPTTFNDAIHPMQTDTYTLGYTRINNTSKLKASNYYVDLKNEFYYYTNGLAWVATINTNENIDESHKYGLDISYLQTLNENWKIATGYNYVKALIDDEKIDGKNFSGNELPGVSNHSAQASLSYLPDVYTTVSLSQMYRSSAYAQLDFGNNFSQKQNVNPCFYSIDQTALDKKLRSAMN